MRTVSPKTLVLENFALHKRSSVDLPARGLVLVQGENGHGKSSLVEAVSWAGWGKTIRGTPPWAVGQKAKCLASFVTHDGLDVSRSRVGHSTLTWSVPGHVAPKYESPTHAQEALEKEIGGWEVWRRSHVFSSVDAQQFGLATDGDRKRLLETMLGLDVFDGALKEARALLKDARNEEEAASRALRHRVSKATSTAMDSSCSHQIGWPRVSPRKWSASGVARGQARLAA